MSNEYIKKELLKVSSIEEFKTMDKRIMIPGIIILGTVLGIYYYLVIMRSSFISPKIDNNIPKTNLPINQPQTEQNNFPQQLTLPPLVISNIQSLHMDINTIPASDKTIYTNTFNLFRDYFNNINKNDYTSALKYIDGDSVSKNNITSDNLKKYCIGKYYSNNNFYIQSIKKNNNIYTVKVNIIDYNNQGIGYFANIDIIDSNGKLSIMLKDII